MRLLLTADPLLPVPPPGYGGIERIVDALARAFRSAGHEVALLAHAASTAPVDKRFEWPVSRPHGLVEQLRNSVALRQAVRQFRPDVVQSFSRLGYLLPVLATRQRVVMSYQRHTGGRNISLVSKFAGRSLRFTGCSEFICHEGRAAGGAWTAIPNFVELERFAFAASVPADAPLVFLSRLEEIKGPDMAIAIALAAGRRLILAGNRADSGDQLRFFESKIEPWLGRDGIEWIGEIGDQRKSELLGSAAAMLVPIRWNEPFGIVFAEALACGTPVITCPRGATPEIVKPGETGFLIESLEQGVAAVAGVASLDRTACRKDAEARFSVATAAGRYLELYASMTVR